MKKPQNFLKAIPLAMVVCSILVSTAKPASAFWWRKREYLGRLTTSDNNEYARSRGRFGLSTPPRNRNDICRWKYPRDYGNVYGKGIKYWETDCYHAYWVSWW